MTDKKLAPFVPRQFLGTYKLPDNSGQRAGIFQELVEGEPVFIMVMDNGVTCRSLTKHEIKFVDPVEAKEGVDDSQVLEAAAATLMKVGLGASWDDNSQSRVMTILEFPEGSIAKTQTTEAEE